MMANSKRSMKKRAEDIKNALHYRTGKPHEKRNCLKCRQKFMSFGKMNRLCDNCKKSEGFYDYGFSTSHQVLPK